MLTLIIDDAVVMYVGILRKDNNDVTLVVLEYSDKIHRVALLCTFSSL